MKYLCYCLAAVLLAIAGAALPLSRAEVGRSDRKPRSTARVVYVDVDRLVEMHPAWEALSEMNVTFVEVQSASGGVSLPADAPLGASGQSFAGDTGVRVSRYELESVSARSAVRALQQSELDMRQALAVRMRSMRAAMMQGADAQVAGAASDIGAEAERTRQAVERVYGADRLNARLRVSALRAVSGSEGVDTGTVQLKLRRAEEELDRIDRSRAAEEHNVTTAAEAKIAALREAGAAKVDAELAAYESREKARIEQSMLEARNDVLRELGSSGIDPQEGRATPFGGVGTPGAAVRVTMDDAGSGAGDLARMRAGAAGLRIRVKADVGRAVRELAAARGIKVAFDRRDGVPDMTETFVGLMRTHVWNACGPVISGAHGS